MNLYKMLSLHFLPKKKYIESCIRRTCMCMKGKRIIQLERGHHIVRSCFQKLHLHSGTAICTYIVCLFWERELWREQWRFIGLKSFFVDTTDYNQSIYFEEKMKKITLGYHSVSLGQIQLKGSCGEMLARQNTNA